MRKYKISFDAWGLLLFLLVMIPNFIWCAIPAPHDVLRAPSATEWIDSAASVCQVLFVAALCLTVNKARTPMRFTPLILASIICLLLYYLSWVFYYGGLTGPAIILLLTIPPCLAFLLFAIDRKNYVALIPAAAFTVCHLIYGVVNYIL